MRGGYKLSVRARIFSRPAPVIARLLSIVQKHHNQKVRVETCRTVKLSSRTDVVLICLQPFKGRRPVHDHFWFKTNSTGSGSQKFWFTRFWLVGKRFGSRSSWNKTPQQFVEEIFCMCGKPTESSWPGYSDLPLYRKEVEAIL